MAFFVNSYSMGSLTDLQVHCKICKRNGNNNDSFLQRFQTGNMFTHHQKSVILDAEGLEGGPEMDDKFAMKKGEFCLAVLPHTHTLPSLWQFTCSVQDVLVKTASRRPRPSCFAPITEFCLPHVQYEHAHANLVMRRCCAFQKQVLYITYNLCACRRHPEASWEARMDQEQAGGVAAAQPGA